MGSPLDSTKGVVITTKNHKSTIEIFKLDSIRVIGAPSKGGIGSPIVGIPNANSSRANEDIFTCEWTG